MTPWLVRIAKKIHIGSQEYKNISFPYYRTAKPTPPMKVWTTRYPLHYLMLLLLLCITTNVTSRPLRLRDTNLVEIDYESIPSCFEGIPIPPKELAPQYWCQMGLSFPLFLRCMGQNLNLRLEGQVHEADKEFVMECLGLCFHDPEDEPRPSPLLQKLGEEAYNIVQAVSTRVLPQAPSHHIIS